MSLAWRGAGRPSVGETPPPLGPVTTLALLVLVGLATQAQEPPAALRLTRLGGGEPALALSASLDRRGVKV